MTAGPFFGFWALAWAAIHFGMWWLAPLPALGAAGFLVRLFMIQHDCGHGAFFRRRWANDWLGRAIGVLTLTPYDGWRYEHAVHHASTGHLGRRGTGDVRTLTVREYQAMSFWRRLGYRIYRHPLTLLTVGPAYVFMLRQRLPLGLDGNRRHAWISSMGTNLAAAVLAGGMIWLIGLWPFLLIQLTVTLTASSMGVWLFYIQHQFEDTYWARDGDWSLHDAALHGSSYYDLPEPLRWMTASIGAHHVHHLSSRIPFYNLPRVLADHPELRGVSRLSLKDSFGCLRLTLWDEARQRLVSFREARRTGPGLPAAA